MNSRCNDASATLFIVFPVFFVTKQRITAKERSVKHSGIVLSCMKKHVKRSAENHKEMHLIHYFNVLQSNFFLIFWLYSLRVLCLRLITVIASCKMKKIL